MQDPILALIPSGYKAPKLYSILPSNGGGDFTLNRDTVGTRVRKDGLLETLSADVPRLDWLNSDCPNLILETDRTNLTTYNQDLTNADWIKSNSPTVTANQIVSPTGEYSADKIVFGTGVSLITNNATVVNSQSYALSIYLKGEEGGEQVQIDFKNSSSQGVSGTLFTLTNQWQRYSVVLTSNQTSLGLQLRTPSLTETKTIYAWGAQLELGGYVSSCIKTEATTVTRLKDSIITSSTSLFNSKESTFFVQMASFLNTQANNNGIELSGNSGQDRITIQFDTANNQIRCDVRVATSVQAIITTQSFDVTNFNKIAITYKFNEVKFYVNGQLIGTDTSVNLFAPGALTQVRSTIADIASTPFFLQAKIKDLRVYNEALTQSESIKLTTI